jgi:protein-disulfide isomerase
MASRWSIIKSVIETVALATVALAIAYTALKDNSTRPLVHSAAARAARPAAPLPIEPVSMAGAQTSGSPVSKVALIIYSDFQCPFCAKFARETLPTLEKQYVETGKVLLAFRQFPLAIHPFAEKAAEGSLCAARQGKFWPFHDDLFTRQQSLDPLSLQDRAKRLGLNADAFAICLSGQTAMNVESDKQSAEPFQISGTPTFLAGPIVAAGRVKVAERFSGALPIQQFQTVLDSLLRKAGVSTTFP